MRVSVTDDVTLVRVVRLLSWISTEVAELTKAYEVAAQYDEVVLAEQFVAGRELTVALLGRGKDARALPVIEIVAPQGNYDYQHKYFSDDTQYLCPAPLEQTLATEIAEISTGWPS